MFDQYNSRILLVMGSEHNGAIYLIKISSSDSDEDKNYHKKIEELLKPVETLDLDSDSDYSEISDIFEEFHRDSFLRENAVPEKRHLSKIEADWKTVEKFSDEFKKVMTEIREELQVNRPLFDDDEAIEKVLKSSPTPQTPNELNRDTPIDIEPEKDQGSEASSESLVWQRLLKNSEDRFKVSPPVFDAYRQPQKHWLERPAVPWKIVENCRIKCENWLEEIMPFGGED